MPNKGVRHYANMPVHASSCHVSSAYGKSAAHAHMPTKMQVFWAMLVVATGAAIVASQALISASYQIVSQVISNFHVSRIRPQNAQPSFCR